MKIKDSGFWETMASFLDVYLVKNRSCSPNTVKSYTESLNLFLTFLAEVMNIPRQKVTWDCFRRQTVLSFLDWLETTRGCSGPTQAQRLAAIRTFVRYGAVIDLRVMAIQADVEKIEFKKPPGKLVEYLSKDELAVFLAQPDCTKLTGKRNMVFLTLMYDSAARCQEMLDLRIQNLKLNGDTPAVYLTGKGRKTRGIPLMPKTADHLRSYLSRFHPAKTRKADDYVFYTHHLPQSRMSEDNVAVFVRKYGQMAKKVCPSFPERMHPHMIRHTRAMHLYQEGIPLATIADWLGHEQVETSRIYAFADTEMKREATRKVNTAFSDASTDAIWDTEDADMMRKLRGENNA